jgi:hypothetical protein
VCGSRIIRSWWGYVKQVAMVKVTADNVEWVLGRSAGCVSHKRRRRGVQSVRHAAGGRRAGGVGRPGGHRRERQELDRWIDVFAVDLFVALGGRDAAEHRTAELLEAMIDREQLSQRQAVAWLGGTLTVRSATRLVELATPDLNGRGLGVALPSTSTAETHSGNRRCGEGFPYSVKAASLRSAARSACTRFAAGRVAAADIEEVGVQDHLGPQHARGSKALSCDRAFFRTRKRSIVTGPDCLLLNGSRSILPRPEVEKRTPSPSRIGKT